MSMSTLKRFPALMVAITAAWAAQPVFGGAVHQFVLTENSSTNLSVTYDGSPLTVNFVSSDSWNFLLPAGFVNTLAAFNQAWTEPGNSNLVNLVNFGTEITRAAAITSDLTIDPLSGSGVSPVADGTSVQVGAVGGVAVFATFNDKAAASEAVPDTGTTRSLLALSLIGLAFLRRKLAKEKARFHDPHRKDRDGTGGQVCRG
jgi:hypothetical protein